MSEAAPITAPQMAAARMLIARLRSEAAQQNFDFDELGITWLLEGDPICATVDDGTDITVSDLLYANMVLMWTLVVDQAVHEDIGPTDVVARLGLSLAAEAGA